ncbi:hypothetical protein J4206_04485 [Candidatus Woesearchaeota archaeon]|nr:hypothetical protein [Candidatus Woesearchaeota archaeon]
MKDLSTKIGKSRHLVILAILVIVILILSGCESQESSVIDDDFEDDDAQATTTPAAPQPQTPQASPQTNVQQPQKTPTQTPQQAAAQQTTQTQSTLPQKPLNTEFIDIIDREFTPLNMEIPVNTTVVWMHKDEFRPLIQHVIRVRTKGIGDELIRSERLSKGQNLSYRFTTPGTYEYMDVLFIKDMDVGKITVR